MAWKFKEGDVLVCKPGFQTIDAGQTSDYSIIGGFGYKEGFTFEVKSIYLGGCFKTPIYFPSHGPGVYEQALEVFESLDNLTTRELEKIKQEIIKQETQIMATKTTIEKTCDIQGCGSHEAVSGTSLQVIFHTEQTEGRGVKPYLTIQTLDVCEKCMEKIVEGNYVHGSGAQGVNEYYFKG